MSHEIAGRERLNPVGRQAGSRSAYSRKQHHGRREFAVDPLVGTEIHLVQFEEGLPVDETARGPFAAAHVLGVRIIGID